MILRINSKNSLVKILQQKLNVLGFTIAQNGAGSPGNETDFFGKLTENAVKRFQSSNKLKSDGIVDTKTWGSIFKDTSSAVKPVYKSLSAEDYSDPDNEMLVVNTDETLPTSSHITELVNLIHNSKITRNISRLIFHCTATQQNVTVSSIQNYWKNKLKWKSPGYHLIIKPDGSWTQLSDFNNITNGVAGINATSIHVSYIGGIDEKGKSLDNRTQQQKEMLEIILLCFAEKNPKITFHAHYEFSNKSCPSFNVKSWIDSIDY